jgi:hypothetical protein
MDIKVKHHISGRVRLKSTLFKSQTSLESLYKYLEKKIIDFKPNQKCQSLILLFDEKLISLNELLKSIKQFFNPTIEDNVQSENRVTNMVKVGLFSGFSIFNFIKTYLFEIKKLSDATMSIVNLGKYVRFIF